MNAPFNLSARKVGGIRFVKIGRLTFSFCVARRYRPPTGRAVVRHSVVVGPDRVTVRALSLPPELRPPRQRLALENALIMFLAALAILPAALVFVAMLAGHSPADLLARAPTACEIAAAAPTDANVEACFGIPVSESRP